MFLNALAYSKAAKILNEKFKSESLFFLLLPSQVNAALSLELYFKCLYFIEKKQDFKIKGRYSHDFHDLFTKLSDEVQNKMERDFRSIIETRDMKDVYDIEHVSGVKIPLDLENNLKSWSEVFTKVRYVFDIFDHLNKPISMMFFPEIEQVIKNTIFAVRPDLYQKDSI